MHRAEAAPFPLKRRQIQVREKCIHDPAKPNMFPHGIRTSMTRVCFGQAIKQI